MLRAKWEGGEGGISPPTIIPKVIIKDVRPHDKMHWSIKNNITLLSHVSAIWILAPKWKSCMIWIFMLKYICVKSRNCKIGSKKVENYFWRENSNIWQICIRVFWLFLVGGENGIFTKDLDESHPCNISSCGVRQLPRPLHDTKAHIRRCNALVRFEWADILL